MYDIRFSSNDFEVVWWDSQLKGLVRDKHHFSYDTQYGADFENIEKSIETVVKKSDLPIKSLPGLSLYRPGDDCELTHKLHSVFESEDGDTVIDFEAYKTYVHVRVWSTTQEKSKTFIDKIMMAIPLRDPPNPKEDMIPMAFWQFDEQSGAACSIKDIQCPSIDEIAENYPEDVLTSLTELGDLERPDELGKILIFHGPPGSGKTHAVRALARQWANNADSTVELIIDPELMLNQPSYIRGVLLNGDKPADARRQLKKRLGQSTKVITNSSSPDDKDKKPNEKPLRLIIIEDSAELFSSDCRATPGFARLLNVTDGIIGQGLRCIFLLTANEELGKIDPAIKRPGRCIQCLNFPALPKDQANEWLASHGCKNKVKDDTMLADLYAIKGAKARKELLSGEKTFGFAPSSK